jgi:hypothetical protein
LPLPGLPYRPQPPAQLALRHRPQPPARSAHLYRHQSRAWPDPRPIARNRRRWPVSTLPASSPRLPATLISRPQAAIPTSSHPARPRLSSPAEGAPTFPSSGDAGRGSPGRPRPRPRPGRAGQRTLALGRRQCAEPTPNKLLAALAGLAAHQSHQPAGPSDRSPALVIAKPALASQQAPAGQPGDSAGPAPAAQPDDSARPAPAAGPGESAGPAPAAGPGDSARPVRGAQPGDSAGPIPAARSRAVGVPALAGHSARAERARPETQARQQARTRPEQGRGTDVPPGARLTALRPRCPWLQ